MTIFPERDMSLKSGRYNKKADDLFNAAYAEGVKPAEERRILRECGRYRVLAKQAKVLEKGKRKS